MTIHIKILFNINEKRDIREEKNEDNGACRCVRVKSGQRPPL